MTSEQISGLLQDLIDDPPELEEEVQTRWTLSDTPADAWSFLLLLVGL